MFDGALGVNLITNNVCDSWGWVIVKVWYVIKIVGDKGVRFGVVDTYREGHGYYTYCKYA